MEQRLLHLLQTVVDEYVATAEPVGSQRLVERYRLDVSPATIRNWFAELEGQGLIVQPHTSGGRVPTEKGFLAYVAAFVTSKPASKRDRDHLVKAVSTADEKVRRLKAAAKMLSELSGLSAVAGLGEADTFYTGLSQLFAQPEFQDWQRVVSLTEVLDRLDETMHALRRRRFDRPQILLGSECPFGSACGAVFLSTSGALLGILGPLRMDYQQALSLMVTVKEILEARNS